VEGEEEDFLPPCDFSEAKSRMRERSCFWLSPPAAMGSEGEAARGTLRRIRGARGGNGVGSMLFWSGGPSNQYRGLSLGLSWEHLLVGLLIPLTSRSKTRKMLSISIIEKMMQNSSQHHSLHVC
jgi:hypothetical protein